MTDTITRTLVDGEGFTRAQQAAIGIMWATKAAVSIDEANRYILAAIDDGEYTGPMECFEGHLEVIHYPNDYHKFKVWIVQEEPTVNVVVERTVTTVYHDTYVVPASLVPKLRDLEPYRVPKAITDEGYTLEIDDPVDTDSVEIGVMYE